MSLIVSPTYKELALSLGPYLATMQIAKNAREIAHSLDNRITYSLAIDYAARGEVPDPKDYPDHRLDRVKNYISYVNDIEVRSAIIASYENSLAKNYLIYNYKNVEDEPRKARVRIIMNILWDKRPHKNN